MTSKMERQPSTMEKKEMEVENGAVQEEEEDDEPEVDEAAQKKKEWKNVWVVIFGFYILLVENGILNVFTKPVREHFDCSQAVATVAIVVVPNAVSLMSGPIAAIFYQLWGARVGITTGGLLSGVGFVAASFTPSIYRMFAYSLMIGFGCGLMRTSILSVQCEYFTARRRSLVMSIICIGPGIGVFLFPRLLLPINQIYTWKGGWRFIAALFFICSVMGGFVTRGPSMKRSSVAKIFGIKVWSNPGFLFHQFGSFCASATCIVYVSHTLMWMRNNDVKEPELVYSFNGIASIIGRVTLTLCLEFTNLHIGVLMVLSYFGGQIAMGLAGFCSSGFSFGVLNAFAGFGFGLYQTCLGPYLVRLVGPEILPNALGYTNLFNGLAAFSSVSFSGWLVEVFDNVNAEFAYLAIVATISCAFSIASFVYLWKRDRRARKIKEQKSLRKAESMRKKPLADPITSLDIAASVPLREAKEDDAEAPDGEFADVDYVDASPLGQIGNGRAPLEHSESLTTTSTTVFSSKTDSE